MLGNKGKLEFTQDDDGLKVKLPAAAPCKYAYVLKITGLKMNPPTWTASGNPQLQPGVNAKLEFHKPSEFIEQTHPLPRARFERRFAACQHSRANERGNQHTADRRSGAQLARRKCPGQHKPAVVVPHRRFHRPQRARARRRAASGAGATRLRRFRHEQNQRRQPRARRHDQPHVLPRLWPRVLAMLKPGDFVIMQFGTNGGADQRRERGRARGELHGIGDETQAITNMVTKKFETVHSFGWYEKQMIIEARSKGATPMVCSLIPRNSWRERQGRAQRHQQRRRLGGRPPSP
jgi:hypothetical protein